MILPVGFTMHKKMKFSIMKMFSKSDQIRLKMYAHRGCPGCFLNVLYIFKKTLVSGYLKSLNKNNFSKIKIVFSKVARLTSNFD